MKHMYKLIAAVLFLTASVYAQSWQKVDSVFAPSGVVVPSFTAPYFYDANDDGFDDLYLGSYGSQALYYENSGKEGEPFFNIDTAYLGQMYHGGSMGTNSHYVTVADLNGDGTADIFTGGFNGVLYYVNNGTDTEPVLVKDTVVFKDVNTEIGTDAKFEFVDIDNDGDLDLYVGTGESFFGGPEAGIVIGFRNTGDAENPVFEKDGTLTEKIADIGLNAFPTFADINNDGTYDLLLGRDLKTLVYYTNTGTPESPNWQDNSWFFNFVDDVNYWKVPAFTDLDQDGDLDLTYGTDGGRIYYYENTGTASSPSFSYRSTYFRVIKNTNSGATASLGDIDNDGDLDLLSGDWSSSVTYFSNEGTESAPDFRNRSNTFSGVTLGSAYNTPVFADYDNDGDLDIVYGTLNGSVGAYRNTDGNFTADTETFSEIEVSGMSKVTFADIENDGDIDFMIAGDGDYDYGLYLNDGEMNYTRDTTITSALGLERRGAPTLYDVDNDEDYDLIIGSSWGDVYYYENTGDADTPIFEENTEVFAGIEVSQSARVAFGDLDGDSRPDMVIAEYNGTLSYYKNLFATTGVEDEFTAKPAGFKLNSNYPNPFNPTTVISFSLPEQGQVNLTVFNSIGEKVNSLVDRELTAGVHKVDFNGSALSSGVYYYHVVYTSQSGNTFRQTGKMMLLK